jgi:hypothetical protein
MDILQFELHGNINKQTKARDLKVIESLNV